LRFETAALSVAATQSLGEQSQESTIAKWESGAPGSPVIIPVRVNENDYRVLVDTGSNGSDFDSDLASDLGRFVSHGVGTFGGKTKRTAYYEPPELRVGTMTLFSPLPVSCRAIREQERRLVGTPLDGILGMDYFREKVIEFDFDRCLFHVSSQLSVEATGGCKCPLIAENGQFYVDCAINGVKVRALVDTGFIGSVGLDEKTFKEVSHSKEDRISEGGFYCDTIKVGEFEHKKHLIAVHRTNVIGLYYLNRYRVAIDAKDKTMHLLPGRRFAHKDHSMCDGAWLDPGRLRGRRSIALGVVKESLAADRGLRRGDILRKYNGRDVDELETALVEREWSQDTNAKIMVEVLRNAFDEDESNDEFVTVHIR
jgi:hypothetical protein